MTRVTIVGAGLAGLSAAVKLSHAGAEVKLYESTDHAGGRCRSFHSQVLDEVIDNGNHLILGANKAALKYIELLAAEDKFIVTSPAQFPFVDVRTGEGWNLQPRGFWVGSAARRVLGTQIGDYVRDIVRLSRAGRLQTVREVLDEESVLYQRFWQPVTESVMNTPVETASAALLWRVVKQLVLGGGGAFMSYVAKESLAKSLVDPALTLLQQKGCEVQFQQRLKVLEYEGEHIARLVFTDSAVEVGPEDKVILAVPAPMLGTLLPEIEVPKTHHTIVNVHFRYEHAASVPYLGIVGGTAQWLFFRKSVLSTTTSAADTLAEKSEEEIAEAIWQDVQQALGISGSRPPYHVIKEKRATFAQTPENLVHRPGIRTAYSNLFIAGDYTDTGLPATIDGAIQSGFGAAELCMRA